MHKSTMLHNDYNNMKHYFNIATFIKIYEANEMMRVSTSMTMLPFAYCKYYNAISSLVSKSQESISHAIYCYYNLIN